MPPTRTRRPAAAAERLDHDAAEPLGARREHERGRVVERGGHLGRGQRRRPRRLLGQVGGEVLHDVRLRSGTDDVQPRVRQTLGNAPPRGGEARRRPCSPRARRRRAPTDAPATAPAGAPGTGRDPCTPGTSRQARPPTRCPRNMFDLFPFLERPPVPLPTSSVLFVACSRRTRMSTASPRRGGALRASTARASCASSRYRSEVGRRAAPRDRVARTDDVDAFVDVGGGGGRARRRDRVGVAVSFGGARPRRDRSSVPGPARRGISGRRDRRSDRRRGKRAAGGAGRCRCAGGRRRANPRGTGARRSGSRTRRARASTPGCSRPRSTRSAPRCSSESWSPRLGKQAAGAARRPDALPAPLNPSLRPKFDALSGVARSARARERRPRQPHARRRQRSFSMPRCEPADLDGERCSTACCRSGSRSTSGSTIRTR